MSESEAATSSNTDVVMQNVENVEECQEPDAKKRKVSNSNNNGDGKKCDLENRLGGILCCTVCLDLPRAAVYQCPNGHLMCAGCFMHILADARIRDEMATCPMCRVEISKTNATRNLAVESAVSELPSECQFCNKQYPRHSLERHEQEECDERTSMCKYNRIGCPWRGPEHERSAHEFECDHPRKSGAEVMEALKIFDQKLSEERKLFDTIFDLLGYDKIVFNEVQLKPCKSDEFVHRLYYESARFSAFNNQWMIKACVNDQQRDPTQASERHIDYKVILRSKPSPAMNMRFLAVQGPVSDIIVKPKIYEFEFTEKECESPYVTLPLPNTVECNRILAAKTINFRLIMFLATK